MDPTLIIGLVIGLCVLAIIGAVFWSMTTFDDAPASTGYDDGTYGGSALPTAALMAATSAVIAATI